MCDKRSCMPSNVVINTPRAPPRFQDGHLRAARCLRVCVHGTSSTSCPSRAAIKPMRMKVVGSCNQHFQLHLTLMPCGRNTEGPTRRWGAMLSKQAIILHTPPGQRTTLARILSSLMMSSFISSLATVLVAITAPPQGDFSMPFQEPHRPCAQPRDSISMCFLAIMHSSRIFSGHCESASATQVVSVQRWS